MVDTSRPIEHKIDNAIEHMRKLAAAAKAMREQPEPQQPARPTVERQTPNR